MKARSILSGLVAVAVLLAAAGAAHAQLYRCKKGGSIVYTEYPCGPDAQYRSLDGQAPSLEDADAARKRASAAAKESGAIDAERSARRERSAAPTARPPENLDEQAEACVARYKPHLAYKAVRIESKRVETDGFGRTLYVHVPDHHQSQHAPGHRPHPAQRALHLPPGAAGRHRRSLHRGLRGATQARAAALGNRVTAQPARPGNGS